MNDETNTQEPVTEPANAAEATPEAIAPAAPAEAEANPTDTAAPPAAPESLPAVAEPAVAVVADAPAPAAEAAPSPEYTAVNGVVQAHRLLDEVAAALHTLEGIPAEVLAWIKEKLAAVKAHL